MESEDVADYRRKQDCVTLCIQRTNEVMSTNLIRKRMVQEDDVAVLFSFDAFKQGAFDALAVCMDLVGGMLLFSCPNQFPEFLFGH